MTARAVAKNVQVSPYKVRLILETIRGKPVEEALQVLLFLPSPTAREVAKVVRSAAANAENIDQIAPQELRLTAAYADEGRKLKRFRPRSRGRVGRVTKRSSHITIVVDQEVT